MKGCRLKVKAHYGIGSESAKVSVPRGHTLMRFPGVHDYWSPPHPPAGAETSAAVYSIPVFKVISKSECGVAEMKAHGGGVGGVARLRVPRAD